MNDTKNLLKMGVVALVISLGVVFSFSTEPVNTVVKEIIKDTGAVANNQPTEPFYFQGGLTSKSAGFISTTTVACMIQNTTGATTTVDSFAWKVDTSTSTVTVMQVSTSTNASRFATSTSVLSRTLAANTKGVGSYVPASDVGALGPGDWIKVGYGAGTTLPLVAQAQKGYCSALFNNIQ